MFSGNEVFLYILVDFLDPLSQNVIQGSRMLSADDVRALSTPRGKGKAWISTEKKRQHYLAATNIYGLLDHISH
jgi:hypothetical protein